ncbi:MAG: hypothetical protein ABGZ36_02165, partial [Actinomycetota bacterium]
GVGHKRHDPCGGGGGGDDGLDVGGGADGPAAGARKGAGGGDGVLLSPDVLCRDGRGSEPAVGVAAARAGDVVLLVDGTAPTDATMAWVADHDVTRIAVAGGESAITPSSVDAILPG